jgi:hypothetical protein
MTTFRFDTYRCEESRWLWIHKQEEEFHGLSDLHTYSIPVTPLCVSDFAEISITLNSLMGILK